jgi:hypothetical protein
MMSFYGLVIAFTVLLCALQISTIVAYSGYLNAISIQYTEVANYFAKFGLIRA